MLFPNIHLFSIHSIFKSQYLYSTAVVFLLCTDGSFCFLYLNNDTLVM